MIYLQLYYEFLKIGLFSIGGGLATIPFLQDLGERTAWYTAGELGNMIAISESTPGPIGINMATYVGLETAGFFGGVLATLGMITPSICIIICISKMLQQFRDSPVVQGIFYGIRPASAALIVNAGVQMAVVAFGKEVDTGSSMVTVVYTEAVLFGLLLWGLMCYTPLEKVHPIVFILFSAVIGGVFSL